jgi:hypothetical protein
MTVAIPLPFEPDRDALFRVLAGHIDDGMLQEIAEADYGYGVEEALASLRPLRAGGDPLLAARPRSSEVLELIRWSRPENPEHKPGSVGDRGHWMRAFSCLSKHRADGSGALSDYSPNETLGALVDSIETLAEELWPELGRFLSWWLHQLGGRDESDDAFFGAALLWCAIRDGAADGVVIQLCEWTCDREKAALFLDYSPEWLHRTIPHNSHKDMWEALGRRMAARDGSGRGQEAREWIALIGSSLAGNQPD